MKKPAALVMLLILLMTLGACGGHAGDEGGLILTTGDETGTYYQFGNLLAQKVNTVTTSFVAVVSSEGSKDNIHALERDEAQLAFSQYDTLLDARQGRGTFRVNGPNRSFSAVAALYPEAVHIVTLDPDIASVADLAGKRVSLGPAGAGSYANAVDILNAYGLTQKDVVVTHHSMHDAAEALLGGWLDAAFMVAGAPVGTVTALAEDRPVYLISLDEEHIRKLIAEKPAYSRVVIGADAYGTAEECVTVAIDAVILADREVSEDAVYDFMRGIFDHTEELKTESPFADYLSLELAASVAGVPYHPGAARYYAEHGITVPTG